MNGITDPAVEKYLHAMLPQRDEVLRTMEAEAEKRKIPIVGPVVGRLLYELAQIARAKTVFEMGSAIGYSTIWWARAVGDGGRVTYTDGSRRNADEAAGHIKNAGVAERVDIRVGDALEILSEQKPESFDIVFCDIDKQDYPRAFRVAPGKVKRGGLFITDNVLWRGQVARPEEITEDRVRAIVEFNRLLYSSRELLTTILPVRDGVAVCLKL